jgi:hypothetical protein
VTERNGRFGPGNQAAVRKAKQAPGHNGIRSYAGYISSGETSRDLIGAQKWVTFANAFSFPPVAIAALLRWALSSGAKWSVVENPSGSADAVKGAEVVEQGLLNARLLTGETWAEVAAKDGMRYFNGASIHAAALSRRKDGMVVFTDIDHRPLNTIEQWLRPQPTSPFASVVQQVDGVRYPIDLSECLYTREGMMSSDPFGVGVLRLVVERIRRAGLYETLEGSEIFSSLGGLPIVYVPIEEIYESIGGGSSSEREAEFERRTAAIQAAARDRVKTPEKQQYVMLDSKTYEGPDQKPSNIAKWRIEVVKAELQGLEEVRGTIQDEHMNVARILNIAFAYIGGGDTKGTHGAHSSMVDTFLRQLQGGMDRTAHRATQQLARRQVLANGLDPDVACPTVRVENLTRASVTEMLESLDLMNKAALHPEDPVRVYVREHYDVGPEPDDVLDDMRAPRPKVTDSEDEDITDEGTEEEDQADKDKAGAK